MSTFRLDLGHDDLESSQNGSRVSCGADFGSLGGGGIGTTRRSGTVNAAYWCLHREADINAESSMDIVGEYNPPDSGFNYKKLNIIPRKPSFYK